MPSRAVSGTASTTNTRTCSSTYWASTIACSQSQMPSRSRSARASSPTTAVSAVAITIGVDQRGRGLSKVMLEGMRKAVAARGLADLVAPVRPSQKHRYPLTPIDRYVEWRRDDGKLVDAWLRVHEDAGAELVRVAPRSMRISGSIADWESWTGMRFPDTGTYVVPGALVPVEIDRGRD